MSIVIGNRPLSLRDLSERARLVLSWIDGGPQWFEWAAGSPAATHRFEDETAMLRAVQAGLHDSPLLLLPEIGLLVGPAKLMTLRLDDLRLLAHAGSHAEIQHLVQEVARIGEAEHLFFYRDFDKADVMLAAMQVASAPLFRTRSLMEQVALVELERDGVCTSPLAAEAAAFAVARAGTVRTFVDLVRTYLRLAETVPGDRRVDGIDHLLTALRTVSFGALEGPRVQGLASLADIRAAVANWLQSARAIGFARTSLAIEQLVSHGGYSGETRQPPATMMQHYMSRAQALLGVTQFAEGRLEQDGATMRYTARTPLESIELELSPQGVLTIARYCPST